MLFHIRYILPLFAHYLAKRQKVWKEGDHELDIAASLK